MNTNDSKSKSLASSVAICMFLILPLLADAQRVNYQQLKAYEGLYQYVNHSTLKIAASPKDSNLYAIIQLSKYKLRPQGNDVFLNSGNQPVTFLRDQNGKIKGYTTDRDTFKLLSRNVSFPQKMWSPRLVDQPEKFIYHYQQPAQLRDALQTGDMKETGLNAQLLSEMMHNIVAGKYPDVHSILIVKDKKLVFEEYFYEYSRDSLQEMRSASKSVISAVTGIAIHQGLIKSVNDKLKDLLPSYHFANPSPLKDAITLQDLLDNQSGVNYDIASPKAIGNEVAMGVSKDWVKYTFDLPIIDTPGKIGRYNSGNPITVGWIIQQRAKIPMYDFAARNLFGPLNITDFKWDYRPDPSNSENFCQVFLTPRDMAKFGLLYLNKGVWNGKQVVPVAWVAESTAIHSVVQGINYGYFWWLKYFDADGTRYYSFAAQGNGGQRICVFRDLDLIVVTTGGNYNTQSPADELIKKYVLPSFNKNNDK